MDIKQADAAFAAAEAERARAGIVLGMAKVAAVEPVKPARARREIMSVSREAGPMVESLAGFASLDAGGVCIGDGIFSRAGLRWLLDYADYLEAVAGLVALEAAYEAADKARGAAWLARLAVLEGGRE